MLNKKPMVLVFAGPNGSGKSTIKQYFEIVGEYTNAVARVKARFESGGHNVEKEKIIERYYKALDNISILMDICDILHVYDNTISPNRIIRKHKEEISIFPNEFWSDEQLLELIE